MPYGMPVMGGGGSMAFPWMAVAGIGGGLLSGLFGSKKKEISADDLSAMFGSGALSKDTLALYNMLAQSPQFRNTLSQNLVAGQGLSNRVTQGLGARGLTTSGIGTIAQSIGGSAAGFGEAQLRGGLFGQAGGMALQNLLARLQAFTELQGQQANQPNFFQQLGGSLLGAGGTSLLGGR